MKCLHFLQLCLQLSQTDRDLDLGFTRFHTRTHRTGHFELIKNKKLKTDENLLLRSQPAANFLLQRNIIHFDMTKARFILDCDKIFF